MWLIKENIENRYLDACIKAVKNNNYFSRFRRIKKYQSILSGGERKIGTDAIKKIRQYNKLNELINHINIIKESDVIGKPIKHSFNNIGRLDPTTLKYFSDYIEIKNFYGKKFNNIIEIGGGYGGLCLILSKFVNFNKYFLIDLPPPLRLQKKFLQKNAVKKILFIDDIEKIKKTSFDLLIADSSLSELSLENIKKYFSLIENSKLCYIKFNTLHLKEGNLNYKYLKKKLNKKFKLVVFFEHWNKAMILNNVLRINIPISLVCKSLFNYFIFFVKKIFGSLK